MTAATLRLATSRGAELRPAALVWALLHAPLILLLYTDSIAIALDGIPFHFQAALFALYVVEAAVAAGLVFSLALPLSLWPRVYRYAFPAVFALAMVVTFIDSRLYISLNFHINAFFFRVVTQPGMSNEVGLGLLELVGLTAAWSAWMGLSVWGGSRFLARFRRARAVWTWLALLVALEVADRLSLALLNFYGGSAVAAAGQVLPMQVRFTQNRRLARLTGRPMIAGPLESAARTSQAMLPAGVSPDSVHFARRPDVVLVLMESTRADFLDAETMPKLWARAQRGSHFLRHYSAATSTHYSVFSLFYALQSQKMEAVIGVGRPPLLFGALQANGYATRLLAASSVEWMDMRETVFRAVENDLLTDMRGKDGAERDASMLAMARRVVAAVDTAQPLFLFLFFDGTHYTYSYSPSAERFQPSWDGRGTGGAALVSPERLRNRARNAAHEVDRRMEAFLTWFGRQRGREPLIVVTGDHGEEYREHGRVGHGTAVTVQQAQVPMVITGPGVPVGPISAITSSVDIVPTIFALLGDTLATGRYSDGMSMYAATAQRFVLTSVGWKPRYAVIGSRLKATFATSDAGLGSLSITDPWDRPLPDARAHFASEAANILRAFSPPSP